MCDDARSRDSIASVTPLPPCYSNVTDGDSLSKPADQSPPSSGLLVTVRIAVLGCGGIARVAHLPSLARTPGARVVALSDMDPAALAAAGALAPGARTVAHYAHVLEMADVDAVIVALPPAMHAEAAIAALEHGRHVYIEKPLSTSLADARRVVAASADAARGAAAGNPPIAMMGFNYRWNPLIRQTRDAIASGGIGRPLAVRTTFSTAARTIPQWKQHRDTGGGVLLDLGVHHIDLVRFLAGAEVATVSAELRSVKSEHDMALLQMALTNGVMVQSLFSLSAVDEDCIDVYGAGGKVSVDRYRSLRVETMPATAAGALGITVRRFVGEMRALPYALRKMRAPLSDPSFPAALQAFVRTVRDGSIASPNVSDGLQAAMVIEAAEVSARTGRVVALDDVAAAGSTTREPNGDLARA